MNLNTALRHLSIALSELQGRSKDDIRGIIKRQHRFMARRYHTDQFGRRSKDDTPTKTEEGASERFRDAQEAKDYLEIRLGDLYRMANPQTSSVSSSANMTKPGSSAASSSASSSSTNKSSNRFRTKSFSNHPSSWARPPTGTPFLGQRKGSQRAISMTEGEPKKKMKRKTASEWLKEMEADREKKKKKGDKFDPPSGEPKGPGGPKGPPPGSPGVTTGGGKRRKSKKRKSKKRKSKKRKSKRKRKSKKRTRFRRRKTRRRF